MIVRSLAVAALTLAGAGVASAQSVYLYVAPGASVYVTPPAGGYGAPAVYPGPVYPGAAVAPAGIVGPVPAPYGEVAPQVYVAPGPVYGPGYEAPLSAYGAAPGVVVRRRVYVEEPPRPVVPVPSYGWRRW